MALELSSMAWKVTDLPEFLGEKDARMFPRPDVAHKQAKASRGLSYIQSKMAALRCEGKETGKRLQGAVSFC